MIEVKANNGIVQKQKNAKRLKEISDAVYSALSEVWEDEFNLEVVNHQEFEEDNFNYYNFRISLNAYY